MKRLGDLYRTALVTGASSGLGQAFADMLLAEGVEVWGTSRRPETLEAKQGFHPVGFDLDEKGSGERLWSEVSTASQGIDLLINNAGYGMFGRFVDREVDAWIGQINGMIAGTLNLTHQAYSEMSRRGSGCLVNVTSLAVEFPMPLMSGYNVAKAGLSALTQSLLVETQDRRVKVLDFRPGDYRTPFNQSMKSPGVSSERDALIRRIWARLEANIASAPGPERAARDLRRALLRGRNGVIRSGGFFQARVAPFLSRFGTDSMRLRLLRFYFGVR